jgi:hypothetical protein
MADHGRGTYGLDIREGILTRGMYYTRTTIGRQISEARLTALWHQPCRQTLPAGYVFQRAAAYVRPLGWLIPLMERLGLSKLPLTYNMGQTLFVCRKQNG